MNQLVLRRVAMAAAFAYGIGDSAAFSPLMPPGHLQRPAAATMSLRRARATTGAWMQLQPPGGPSRKQRLSAARQPAARPFAPAPLEYKADIADAEMQLEAEVKKAGMKMTTNEQMPALEPLDWAGKPLDSIRRLFSDYAPRMNEKEAFLWLVFVVALCGINFPLTKFVGEAFDGPTVLTARFAIASVCFLPWASLIRKETLPAGLETGAWLSAGYIAQAVCLTGGTNSGVASFFASMSCVLCPFFERMVGVQLSWRAWAAAAVGLFSAFVLEVGPGLLEGGGDVTAAAAAAAAASASAGTAMPNFSDLVGLLQPVFFGAYLFRTERAMQRMPNDAMPLTALQVFVTTALCAAWGLGGPLIGDGMPSVGDLSVQAGAWLSSMSDPSVLEAKLPAVLGLLWMGVLPSGLSLALETVIVHKLSSSVTALTFTLEPVFAAVVGTALLHEDFGVATAVGGVLAISAVLIRCADPQQLEQAFKETTENIKAQFLPKSP